MKAGVEAVRINAKEEQVAAEVYRAMILAGGDIRACLPLLPLVGGPVWGIPPGRGTEVSRLVTWCIWRFPG